MQASQGADSAYPSQVIDTYHLMRVGMGLLALAFPLLLWLPGLWWLNIPAQTSLSAYYHTDLRDVFVGVLVAIGFMLLLYKGFSRAEDWALNLAGVLAMGIAFFPMWPDWPLFCRKLCQDRSCLAVSDLYDRSYQPLINSELHGYLAALFFLAIAYVCLFCAGRTLHLIADRRVRRTYHWTYRVLGALMVLLPAAVALITRLQPSSAADCSDFTIIRVETSGVWVFATYWLLKTREARKYGADSIYPDRRAIPQERARAI
jgi:hypothetical protein